MAWSLDGTRIFVQELGEDNSQILPRLQPLAGGTVVQIFGYESDIYKTTFKVVGYVDHDAIKTLTTTGATALFLEYDTSNPVPFSGSYYVRGFSSSRETTLKQTIRGDLDCYSPVFNIEVELYDG